MVGILKKAGKALKEAKKAKETSKFLTRRKTLSGAPKKGYPDWFKQWLKESKLKAREGMRMTDEGKKKQVKKFVDIRKRTKPAWSKK
tara:strand:- start:288 stop:548 length:261 start_codon:yes stop_codon:yes gene_type:complete